MTDMTNPLPESAVELAARAMLSHWTKFPDTARRMAEDALTAALPAIREAVVGEYEAEINRAWTAANRAEAKVSGWESTMVCVGLPIRVCPVDGWGPGADGMVEIPQITPEKLTSILDRLAAAEAALTEQENRNDQERSHDGG